ncbi:MAG TPA: aminotransferase class I/II-fold pyridoxal phosphate-dependent enzyme [bacterium]|nr:aminotransferase class I/II-fold pyridoxal phosphate-dependent enzyme [bacterium]
MIRLMVDTNVPLDVALQRPQWENSDSVLAFCEAGICEGWMVANSFPTIEYVTAKSVNKATAMAVLRELYARVSIIPLRTSLISEALAKYPDNFEDGLQMAAARQFNLDYIVTRNVRHFERSPVPAVTPDEFIEIFKKDRGRKNVPFVDLSAQLHEIYNDIDDELTEVIQSCAFILGPAVTKFEQQFADFCEAKHCVGVSSGTAALHLALLALGIGKGDEVITVPNTFAATCEAIIYTGARPVFVDVDERTFNIDVFKIDAAITPRTRAIIPVHLYGQPADMDPILHIAQEHNLKVIEDACQAHGARYKGKRVGAIGDVGCFSFYPSKNLGAYGDGGAVVTNDPHVSERVRMLRDHGTTDKYHHAVVGYNCRLSSMQAAVLSAKLKRLDKNNEMRREKAGLYGEALGKLDVIIPFEPEYSESVYHLYVIRASKRDRLREHLTSHGISAGLHYPVPLHLQGAFAHLGYKQGDFPVAEKLAAEILSLPMFPELEADAIERCAQIIGRFCSNKVQDSGRC